MLSAILSLAAPSIFTALGATSLPAFAASAIGSGLGALLEGRKGDEALQAAALGGLGSALAGGTSTLGDMARMTPATTTEAGLKVADTTAAAQGLGIAGTKTPNVSDAVLRQAPGIGVKPDPFSLITNKATLAGAAGPALGLPPIMPQFKKDEGPEPPEGMAPVGKPRKAPIGFDPGKEGEFDYRIPRNFQEGGLASLEMDATEMNDKELINKAIDAIQNELPNPEEVLGVFIARFGEEALADLVRKVQDGTFDDTVERSEGMIDGMGDGMDDMVPAKLEGQDDVLLSDGEFIVPADVVSGLGNGSSKAGSDRLYDMMDRVRQMRTGTTEQPDDVPTEQMMPA
tara:strand:+ start:691 stop:1719 length:1029 start_codon:yes stop_codon:yes gene_type:complete